jgi:hypothetical protein
MPEKIQSDGSVEPEIIELLVTELDLVAGGQGHTYKNGAVYAYDFNQKCGPPAVRPAV